MKKCDIIIPVWNELQSTKKCVDALKQHTRYPYRLIIVDNASDRPTGEYLDSLKEIFANFLLIRNSSNLGFVKAVNQGMVSSKNSYVCILNNDSYVTDRWLTFLVDTVEGGPKNIGIANPTSNIFGKRSPDGRINEWQELDFARGFSMLIKREVIERVGLFDEVYGMGYFEEKDFCRRAQNAGYVCVRAKASFVYHEDKRTFGKLPERNELFKRNEEIFNKRWGKPLSIAFIAGKNYAPEQTRELIYELLHRGHRINVFYSKHRSAPALKDHIELKFFPLPEGLFSIFVIFKLRERLKKKKVGILLAENAGEERFFKRLNFIHKAAVLSGKKERVLDFCDKESKEI